MNLKLLAALLIAAAASQAMANQVIVKNASSVPMSIDYKIVHKEPDDEIPGHLILGPQEQRTINFELGNSKLAGVVPVVVNGHKLPAFKLGEPEQCAAATDKTHTSGTMEMSATNHTLSCKTGRVE